MGWEERRGFDCAGKVWCCWESVVLLRRCGVGGIKRKKDNVCAWMVMRSGYAESFFAACAIVLDKKYI